MSSATVPEINISSVVQTASKIHDYKIPVAVTIKEANNDQRQSPLRGHYFAVADGNSMSCIITVVDF